MTETPPEEQIPLRESILASTKKLLNVADDYTDFDDELIMHINTVFDRLFELGVGPEGGFEIDDREDRWSDFLLGERKPNSVKTYVYLRVRLLWDPPTTGHHVAALEKQIEKLEWNLNVQREEEEWTDPHLPEVLPTVEPLP